MPVETQQAPERLKPVRVRQELEERRGRAFLPEGEDHGPRQAGHPHKEPPRRPTAVERKIRDAGPVHHDYCTQARRRFVPRATHLVAVTPRRDRHLVGNMGHPLASRSSARPGSEESHLPSIMRISYRGRRSHVTRPVGMRTPPSIHCTFLACGYVLLASADGSYITGQVLHPNGGEIVNG
jgi:hypothetical protein